MFIDICAVGWIGGLFPFFLAVASSVLNMYYGVLALWCPRACGQLHSRQRWAVGPAQSPASEQRTAALAAKQAGIPCSTTPAVR